MTSRIYGIAVKETVDYYEYDDIKLVFNQDTKQWSVFSNFDNLWMNGVQYHKGDLVVMFADGKVDTYTMMAQYTDTSPYINYMYTITSNFVINPSYYQNGRVEYIFEADPETEPYQFTCKKLLNNVQQNSYTLTDVDIKTYKNQNNGKLPTLFDNMKVDWHGMNPESPYLPYSFTIISNSNYIKDGTTPKQINDIIIQIPAGSGASSYFHRILDETNKHEATPKPGELPSVLMTKKIGKYNAKPSVTFNRETIIRKIYHDHTKVYYNGHYHRAMYLVYDSTGAQGCWKKTIEGLAFTYADPFWLCMTTSAGIELGGQVLEAKRLVRCWKDTDDINLTMRKTKSRKKAAPETAPYDDIIYDVVSNASNVTVTKFRRKTKIDAQGHKTTEDIQEDLPIVFDTGDSPVRCWNIEFRAKNNVWTIYSKCGYIRYGGRQYPKNRSILDFNAGEEMHIEIKDETEKYEVDEVITYTVTNVMVTKFIYKVWTVGESYTIKVEKSAENVDPEPWVTVNFYDAWNEHPVVIDDIQLDYDIKTNIWTLSSASDELYYYGRKINKGEKIAEWGFNTIISLKDERGINVISANAEKDVKVHIDSTKSQPQGLDISEFYPSNDYYNVDFLLTHSVTKGEWVITSKRDDTYMNGVRYTYNKVIFQGSDKQGYPDFTFMCQHKKDESGPIIPTKNIRYTITISWDPYEQIGNLAVQAVGGESKVYYTREKDPAKNTIVLTKQNAKSMYGYIWKRDMPGPTPPTPEQYTWYVIPVYITSDNTSNPFILYGNGYRYIALVRVQFGGRIIKKVHDNSVMNSINLTSPWLRCNSFKDDAYLSWGRYISIIYNNYSGSAKGIENSNRWRRVTSQSNIVPYPYYDQLYSYYAYPKYTDKRTMIRIEDVDDYDGNLIMRMQKFEYSDYYGSSSIYDIDEYEHTFTYDRDTYRNHIDIRGIDTITGILMYIDKDSYLLAYSPYNLIWCYNDIDPDPSNPSIYDNPRYEYKVSKIDLDNFDFIPLHYNINVSASSIKSRTYPDRRCTCGADSGELVINNKILCREYAALPGVGAEITEIYSIFDIETGSLTRFRTYTYSSGHLTNDLPYKMSPQVVVNGKGYHYGLNRIPNGQYWTVGDNIEIRELDPDDIIDCFDGGTVVRTINKDTTISILNLDTKEYDTYTYEQILPIYVRTSGVLDSLYYSELTQRFIETGKNGFFTFAKIRQRPVDIGIFYIPDPTLSNMTNAFYFKASALRYSSEIREHWD